MLTGQAKKDYQREYMRKRRSSGLTYMQERRKQGLDIPKTGKTSESWASRRFRILQRDNFRCQYCGRTAQDDIKLEVDHITPLCQGGTDTDNNLITACLPCNRSKGGTPLNYDAEQSIMDRIEVLQPSKVVRPARRPGEGDNQYNYRCMKSGYTMA